MGRIAKYSNYYDDGIFDDESEQKPEKKFEFTGPLKLDDVPAHQIKKMELLHSLSLQWDIQEHILVAFLMRFIFKAYKPDDPDQKDFLDAINKLKKLRNELLHSQKTYKPE